MKTKKIINYPIIITATLLGGIIGTALYVLIVATPSTEMSLLAFLVGGGIVGMVAQRRKASADVPVYDHTDTNQDASLLLRKEELEIIKNRVNTATVQIHKEIISEDKVISVPLQREELVIQINDESNANQNDVAATETIRIPIREEKVDISTHPVELNDVSIFKDQVKETIHVSETVKREEANVDVAGEAIVHDKDNTATSSSRAKKMHHHW
ncbi:MAG: YsnF/AvaK domain-containing protein [Firmicutes bacterium]|nr:YsnF/AvaK domain-containing protein [Bacillota bacterium]